MKPVAIQTLRSRWFAACVNGALWLLLYLAVIGLGGKTPDYRETDAFTTPAQYQVPVAKLEHLLAPLSPAKPGTDTNRLNAFFTRHFIPTTPPAPPPPTTRKIELTYEGFYEAGDARRHTIVKLGDAFIVTALGGRVASNLFAAQATMEALTLTNPAAQTNILLLNTKKEIEVPIQ